MLRDLLDLAREVADGAGRRLPTHLPPYDPAADEHAALKHEIAALIGDLMRFWGFSRNLGALWTWMYLTPQPLTSAQLQAALKLSAGSVSTALRELRHWGVVRSVPTPGARAEHLTAETNILPAILKVFRERELELIRRTLETLERAREQAAALKQGEGSKAIAGFVEHRLGRLSAVTRMGHGVLEALIQLRTPDFDILRRAFQLQ